MGSATPTRPTTPLDPAALLRELTAADVRGRLSALDEERRSLLVILRAIQARERARSQREGARAD